MKNLKLVKLLFVIIYFIALNTLLSVEVSEPSLKLSSGKMYFSLVKTEWDVTDKMAGIAEEFNGVVDLNTKTLDISISVKRENFYLTGSYKFANDLMHEGYLESNLYPSANYQGVITSYDTSTGAITVMGKLKLHGVTKEKVEISGKLKKSKKGYLFTSKFTINPKDYEMEPPKIKEVNVIIKFELTRNQ